jgi:N-methylhydantoinase B
VLRLLFMKPLEDDPLPINIPQFDPIRLEVFKQLFASIAEEMGVLLQRSSYSPNIKERRDFSCAVFDPRAQMIAQAAHIPVHLGSMPLAVAAAIQAFPPDQSGQRLFPGDVVILNDPFRGGTHLPDITLVSPVYSADRGGLIGYVANRAHHADIGGSTPGSMGMAGEIFQEGIIIPPLKLVEAGVPNQGVLDLLLANVRTPRERSGDLRAQIGSLQRGIERFQHLAARYGLETVTQSMTALLAYSERMTRALLSDLPEGSYHFTDYLEGGARSSSPIPISVEVSIRGDTARVDFTGSASQQPESINAVYAITLSAVYYVFRCLIGLEIPNNSGCLVPIEVVAPEGTVVNASHPAPVAGGNVETSQRIVDVLFGALAQASPDRVPAASQGTMNNVTIGGWDVERNQPFAYYETIGGGTGARPDRPGVSAIHSHMTNTLNTPVEALEFAYPLRVLQYSIRRATGGAGKFRGGDGIRRDFEILSDARVSLLTDRRVLGPYGLAGGEPGAPGANFLIRAGKEQPLPAKGTVDLQAGDVLSIRTPGGGGFGKIEV